MRKRVLVIGASGKIAGQVLPALRARYALTLLDVRAEDRSGRSVEGVEIADLGNADRDAYRAHFSGIDAVVHFGFVRPENDGAEARFRAEMRNVEMAYNVYMTALEEGVSRVVVASSNHAASPLGSWMVTASCQSPFSKRPTAAAAAAVAQAPVVKPVRRGPSGLRPMGQT